MTFDDIVALDDCALNVAIERTCYGRTWHPMQSGSKTPLYNHFEKWDRAMALAWKYAIGIWPLMATQGWLVQQPLECHALMAWSEIEARRHVCRLALWLALQQSQEESSP